MHEQTFVGDRGVIHPMHPAVVDSLMIDAGRDLKAGTVLKAGAAGAVPAGDADSPAYVLAEDAAAGAWPARCLRHGAAVVARLIDASGAGDAPASAALAGKLPAAGIYPVQGFDATKMA
jgi:hypothetical protein